MVIWNEFYTTKIYIGTHDWLYYAPISDRFQNNTVFDTHTWITSYSINMNNHILLPLFKLFHNLSSSSKFLKTDHSADWWKQI